MKAAIRKMGNSSGIILPKPVLTKLGLRAGDMLEMSWEDGDRLVLVAASAHPRAGWEAAAAEIAKAGDDVLAWPEIANAGDADLVW